MQYKFNNILGVHILLISLIFFELWLCVRKWFHVYMVTQILLPYHRFSL